MTPRELAERWRRDAAMLETYDPRLAAVARAHAEQLEEALRSTAEEALDLQTAARESGYSVDRLRHKVAAGEIANAGQKGSPKIRRGDLPAKKSRASSTFDAATTARQLVHGGSNAHAP
jgi:ribosomal protein L4